MSRPKAVNFSAGLDSKQSYFSSWITFQSESNQKSHIKKSKAYLIRFELLIICSSVTPVCVAFFVFIVDLVVYYFFFDVFTVFHTLGTEK